MRGEAPAGRLRFAALAAFAVSFEAVSLERTRVAEPLPLASLEIAGCDTIARDGACVPGEDRALTVWLGVSELEEVTVDGARVDVRVSAIDHGARCRFSVAPGARSARVSVKRGGASFAWSFALAAPPPRPPALDEARALRAAGNPSAAVLVLSEALGKASGEERAMLESARGRAELARGDRSAARAALTDAAASHLAHDQVSSAADDQLVLAHLAIDERRFGEARAALGEARVASSTYAEGRALVVYYEGLLAKDLGEPRLAARLLADAEGAFERLDLARLRLLASEARTLVLLWIGRPREALRELLALGASPSATLSPCDIADLRANTGWAALAAVDAVDAAEAADDPTPLFEDALARYRTSCKNARGVANILGSLALAALMKGDAALARARLADAKLAVPEHDAALALSWLDLEGKIALAEKRYDVARDRYERLLRLARAAGAFDDVFRAADGKAEALQAMGRVREALEPAGEAERVLAHVSRGVPVGEGRGGFLASRERSVRRRIGLLLDTGDVAGAFAAARVARSRLIAEVHRGQRIERLPEAARVDWESALGAYRRSRDALSKEAESDWSLSEKALDRVLVERRARGELALASLEAAVSALPPPGEPLPLSLGDGEVALLFHELSAGAVAFVVDSKRVTAVRLPALPAGSAPDVASRAWLEPLRAALSSARAVRVLAASDALDVHALPWDGAPLVAHAPVVYALDIGGTSAERPAGGEVVAISDPRRDLPFARREADALRRAAEALHLGAPRSLAGRDATRAAALAAFDGAALVHFAGHGTFGGRDGVASALALHDGEIGIGDILALPRAPAWVVLSGCETARAATSRSAESLGIAQAFVAAGTSLVIASSRVVRDEDAAEVIGRLYARLTTTRDLAVALADVQRDLAAEKSAVDWAAFRAYRP